MEKDGAVTDQMLSTVGTETSGIFLNGPILWFALLFMKLQHSYRDIS